MRRIGFWRRDLEGGRVLSKELPTCHPLPTAAETSLKLDRLDFIPLCPLSSQFLYDATYSNLDEMLTVLCPQPLSHESGLLPFLISTRLEDINAMHSRATAGTWLGQFFNNGTWNRSTEGGMSLNKFCISETDDNVRVCSNRRDGLVLYRR